MLKSNKIKWKREQKKAVFSKKYIFPHNKHMVLIHTKNFPKQQIPHWKYTNHLHGKQTKMPKEQWIKPII